MSANSKDSVYEKQSSPWMWANIYAAACWLMTQNKNTLEGGGKEQWEILLPKKTNNKEEKWYFGEVFENLVFWNFYSSLRLLWPIRD